MIPTRSRLTSVAVAFALCALPTAARAVTATSELVYNFTYSSNQSITARDSVNNVEPILVGSGGTSGMSHYGGTLTEKGTLTVDFVKRQPDGAVVVTISEQGLNIRRAPPAECVVYGNTHVICDPNKTVYTEEYTLLRFMGANFVDPSQLDSSKHWQIVQNGGDGEDVSADYTINGSSSGTMQIGEERKIKDDGAGHLTTNIETKIRYDSARLIPISVDEYATQHADSGIKGTSTTTYQTTLDLASGTVAKP
ncbi:MAG: hypothetical protein WB810_17335 [Candidatus Cybelea sp.]